MSSDPSSVPELGPAAAYSAQVAQWLTQAYHAQMIQIGFPSFLAYQASLGRFNTGQSQQTAQQNTNNNPQAQNINLNLNIPGMGMNINLPGVGMNLNLGNNGPAVPVLRATLVQASDANIFVIPPVWKRISSEILDFLILFVLKVMITFIAVDFFELVDLDNYEFPLDLLNLDPENVKLDYNLAVQFTQEILILELIHRLVVCVFEALCTHRGPLGLPGGATPGKVIMGLKIVKCNQVTPLGLNRVRVAPAADLGLGWAIIRSVLKNFSLGKFIHQSL